MHRNSNSKRSNPLSMKMSDTLKFAALLSFLMPASGLPMSVGVYWGQPKQLGRSAQVLPEIDLAFSSCTAPEKLFAVSLLP